MKKPQQTSVVILITLAELAWLAAFGLLFAYRSKVGELGVLRRTYEAAINRLAEVEAGATNVARLVDRLNIAKEEVNRLTERVRTFENFVEGRRPEEIARLLADAETVRNQLAEAEQARKRLSLDLEEAKKANSKIVTELQAATNELAALQRKWNALPPNVDELAAEYRDATKRLQELKNLLKDATMVIDQLTGKVGQLEKGEIAIRRELTGLPTNELRRVVFIVDSSSSMHSSPAWNSARQLMRTWIEHLSVEECMLVNFNDTAVAFPKNGYLRVRDANGKTLAQKKEELLAAFDRAQVGTYSDLLKALKLAYSVEPPDLIVLLTDGHPRIATQTDRYYAGEILKEVQEHPRTPILAVAVGDYEVEGAGGPRERRNAAIAFLKQLAQTTGGTFLGR